MDYLVGFLTIGTIALVAAISPGPDFVIVTKNTLLASRRAGIFTALGVGAGIFIHVAYSIIGIGFIVSKSILLFNIIKLLGAVYLCYLGYQLLRSKTAAEIPTNETKTNIMSSAAFKNGFFTNALNPKATVFFVSVFTQVISPATPLFIRISYGIEIALIVCLWFIALAFILSTPSVKALFARIQQKAEKVMGVILIALGIKVALAHIE